MKKIIGILGVAVIAMAMFFSTNNLNSSNEDLELASLIAIDTANAEWSLYGCCPDGPFCQGVQYCHYSLFASGC